jgi:hypothetical protein
MKCLFCGVETDDFKQRAIPIARLEFRPYIGGEIPGEDNLAGLMSCQGCYAKILANRAAAIGKVGKIKEVEQ